MEQTKKKNHHDSSKQQFFLHELLSQDQEPFLLTNYISHKQNQLTIHSSSSHKPRTLKTSTLFPIHHLCKNALCFNPSSSAPTTTPDFTKSPLFRISPCSARASSSPPNAIFLHVPARTASILLEAAIRIQNYSNSRNNSNNNNGGGFGFFGSFFRRFTQRGRRNKRQIQQDNNNNVKWKKKKKVKDLLKLELDSGRTTMEEEDEKEKKKKKGNVMVDTSEVGFRCSCSEERVCSSSSNADSCCFVVDDDNDFFCESPFRFVLQRSPSATSSSGRRTPEFSSPASSPNRHRTEDKEDNNNNKNNGDDSINKFQSGKQEEEEEEEEDKEQCSPVSVLDPPFEDDDDVHESNDDDGEGFDLDCSYANVQRTKQQLLYRLSRFEKLAELDPLELEQRMLDQENRDIREDGDSESSREEEDLREIVYAILNQSSRWRVPEDLKRLVYDLMMEEEEIAELDSPEDKEMVIKRVCKRLELWKEVESNTIDMMIDEDFSREEIGWKKNAQQVRDLAGELELAIFALLVEEFSEELAI